MFSLCLRTAGGAAVSLGGPAWLGVVVVGGAVIVASKVIDSKASDASGKRRKLSL